MYYARHHGRNTFWPTSSSKYRGLHSYLEGEGSWKRPESQDGPTYTVTIVTFRYYNLDFLEAPWCKVVYKNVAVKSHFIKTAKGMFSSSHWTFYRKDCVFFIKQVALTLSHRLCVVQLDLICLISALQVFRLIVNTGGMSGWSAFNTNFNGLI
jgi:hypothetical protein